MGRTLGCKYVVESVPVYIYAVDVRSVSGWKSVSWDTSNPLVGLCTVHWALGRDSAAKRNGGVMLIFQRRDELDVANHQIQRKINPPPSAALQVHYLRINSVFSTHAV